MDTTDKQYSITDSGQEEDVSGAGVSESAFQEETIGIEPSIESAYFSGHDQDVSQAVVPENRPEERSEIADVEMPSPEILLDAPTRTALIKKIDMPRWHYFPRVSPDPYATFSFKNFNVNTENWTSALCAVLDSLDSNYRGLKLTPQSNDIRSQVEILNEDVTEQSSVSMEIDSNIPSRKQDAFVTFIRQNVNRMSASNNHITKCFLLTGYAGSGKTSTVGHIRDIENSKTVYVAIAQRLCAEASAKYDVKAINFCQFIMSALHMPPSDAIGLIDEMKFRTDINDMRPKLADINEHSFSEIFPTEEINDSDQNSLSISRCVNIVFLDEFSMFPPLALEFFLEILKTFGERSGKKFILILCGDFMHIPPLYAGSSKYEQILENCGYLLNFSDQFRVNHTNYLDTLLKLTEDILLDSNIFLRELMNVVPSIRFSPEIEYTFPFERIEEAYRNLRKYSKSYYLWLQELDKDFFSKILTLKAFVFTNKEMHYMNLSLIFSIFNQFISRRYNVELIKDFISFSTFNVVNREYSNATLQVLPLIRFFPYRLLAKAPHIEKLYHKCIVHLIDWKLEEGKVEVYCPENKKFLTVSAGEFYMNLNKDVCFYGIPLELAFGNTLHSSQGLTFSEDIVVSLNNIDHRELFAVLTRICLPEQIKNLYGNFEL